MMMMIVPLREMKMTIIMTMIMMMVVAIIIVVCFGGLPLHRGTDLAGSARLARGRQVRGGQSHRRVRVQRVVPDGDEGKQDSRFCQTGMNAASVIFAHGGL